jgi:hypothetical protein
MQSEPSFPKPFRFTDPRQERIYERLRLFSPAAPPFYRDACRIMDADPPFDSASHLVAHLMRELESSLRAALEPYKNREEGPKKNNLSNLCEVCRAPLTAENHKDDISALLRGLEIPDDHSIAVAWLNLAGTIHGRAHRDNLAPTRPMDDGFRQFWAQMTDILFVVLDKLESRYLESLPFLDALLAIKAPTKKEAKKLQLFAPNNPATYGYFFHRNNNPAWLKPLCAQKLFDHPQEPISEVVKDGITTSYPPWPQSRYLVRMAASDDPDIQETVLGIALKVETENIAIHLDLADIAKALPAAKAAKLSEKAVTWIGDQKHLFHLLPEKLGELIAHLSNGGEFDAALTLARSVLTVLPNPRATDDENSIWNWHRDPVSRLEGWDYQRVLSLALPDLVAAGTVRTLEMLCDLLETAVDFHQAPVDLEDVIDHSSIWRPDLENRNHDDVKEYLVSAVRKAAEQIVAADLGQVPALVSILESRRWLIFKRLALHLLRLSPDLARDLIIDRLTDRANFDERELWHEYILLMRDHFADLTETQRDDVLGWIDEGPTLDIVKERREKWDGTRLTDSEAEKSEKFRKLRLLAPLRDVLPEDWSKRYRQWVTETEEPQFAEYPSPPPQMGFGFNSPKSAEELTGMSISEILAFLRDWKRPADDPFSPSPEGLGQELTTLVTSKPESFAKEANRFRLLATTYVRCFLSGILAATSQQKAFPWSPIFSLCRWVIKQPREVSQQPHQSQDEDRGWIESRSVVAELLSAGFKEGAADLPFAFRKSAWRLLKHFTDDPNPTPEDEERQGGPEMNPATVSVNTVRGRAIHSLINYARWVQRHLKEEPDGEQRVAHGFDEMPEVRKTLDYHLNPKHDPSLAIRAVYGQWLPWLIMLDQNWVQQNLAKVFPMDESLRELCNVAWEAYITFNGAYNNIFEVLRKEYRNAIERIGERTNRKTHHTHTPDQHLAQQLMLLYARGKLSLDEPEGLLARFYSKAPDGLRGHAPWHVGYSFHESKDEIPDEVVNRFKALWYERSQAALVNPASHVKEMSAFGYLFYSEKFDDAWAIAELRNALAISKRAEPDYFVVQRLAVLAASYPRLAIECLSFLVEGDKEGWRIDSWGMYMRTIIAAALQSGDDLAKQTAIELIHRLGARNHLEFADLRPRKAAGVT